MLKLLIVDDEVFTLKMLQKLLNWEALGIGEIETASDGMEALEKIESFEPHILITDIKMPRMTGISFIEEVKKREKDIAFIFLSAHSDFEYAKKAIKLGCFEYLLKPIDEEELEAAIKKLTTYVYKQLEDKELSQKTKTQHKIHILNKYMKEGKSTSEVRKLLKEIEENYKTYSLISIWLTPETINEYDSMNTMAGVESSYMMKSISELFSTYGNNLVFDYEEGGWLVLLGTVPEEKIYEALARQRELFKVELSLEINLCFSKIHNQLLDLPRQYENIGYLRQYSLYLENQPILGEGYNCSLESWQEKELLHLKTKILQCIEEDHISKGIEALRELFLLSKNMNPMYLSKIYEYSYEIIITIKNKRMDTTLEEISYKSLEKITSMEKLEQFMLKAMGESGFKEGNMKISKLVEDGISFLYEHYNTNISLDEICEVLSISKNYFCHLFKKETGQNIWTYLTEIRMSKARKLLESTDMKSYEIAYHIGYDNPSYFSKLFKKIHECTPNEYRDKKK